MLKLRLLFLVCTTLSLTDGFANVGKNFLPGLSTSTFSRKDINIGDEKSAYSPRWREGFIEHQMKITVFGGGASTFNDRFVTQVSNPTGVDEYHTQTATFFRTAYSLVDPLATTDVKMSKTDERTLFGILDINVNSSVGTAGDTQELRHDYYSSATSAGTNWTVQYSGVFANNGSYTHSGSYSTYIYNPYLAMRGNGTKYGAKIEHWKYLWSGSVLVSSTSFNVYNYSSFNYFVMDALYPQGDIHCLAPTQV
jgi:hypothetical protein